MEVVNVKILLEHTVQLLLFELNQKNITLKTDLLATNHTCKCDPARIQQIFWNLIKVCKIWMNFH